MRDWIEIVSLFVLLLIMVGLVAYGVYWLYDCFYGEWLDEPIVKAVEERPRPRPETYQVQPGDTIWGIYTEFYQGCDWDEVRYKIRKINGLKNDTLYAYEVISLPDVEEKKEEMIELYDHQKVALEYLRLYEGFALFHEQGTGKTIVGLTHIARLALEGKIESALVIAPKAAMGAWSRDIVKFPPAEQAVLEEVLHVINYESVWRKGKGYDRVWDCIILDESHKIKNRTAKQTSFILKLALKAKYRYILTGTPIGNGRLEDLWSQYAFLYPKVVRGRVASELFGTWSQFTDKYCILDQYWKPYRYVNVDEFQKIMDMYCHRVTKEEALDLPDKLPDEIYDIELKEKNLYKELHKDGASLNYDLLLENPLARLTKLRQVCSGFLTLEDGQVVELKSEKLKVLEDFLDGWEKKLVIFCEYKYSIRSISKLLKKLNFKHVILDGEQKDKDIWKQFQSDESIRVIICQYQSGAQGIDLFAADTIIYYEPTLSSTTLEQSRDRIHRMGQTQKCSYIHFITKKSVEEDIYKALARYEDFSERLFESYMTSFTRSYSGGKKK